MNVNKKNIKSRVLAYFLAVMVLFSALVTMPLTAQANTQATPLRVRVHTEGLGGLFIGLPVTARIVFTLDGESTFAPEIEPSDFWVGGLPPGLVAEPAVRITDDVVSIRIVGAPSHELTFARPLTVPTMIHPRNFRPMANLVPVFVAPGAINVGPIQQSAIISPGTITFDLNPYGALHRDTSFVLHTMGYAVRHVRYGNVNLREDIDFAIGGHNLPGTIAETISYTLHTSFLSRLAAGIWELTFHTAHGANAVLQMNIIDTGLPVVPPPQEPIGPPPVPPMTPMHPNDSFMYLTGGVAVNMNDLRWDINRARVSPQVQDGVATVTVRTSVIQNVAMNMPVGTTFEIMTPMVRAHIPVDIFNGIFGGRAAIFSRGLGYHQVDLRISLIDRSEDQWLNFMFNTVYPQGELLSSLVELRVELINAQTGEVILNVIEMTHPVEMDFVVMDNAGHLRPAALLFGRAWLEFVPYRVHTPNEITTRTIFPGVQAVMHNRVHFADVYHTHWGFVHSYTAAYSGLVMPMADLHPSTPITRGEFAQLLAFALQLPRASATYSGFADVPFPHVYFDGISRLQHAGLLGSFMTSPNFRPDAFITREEVATIVGTALTLGEPVRQPDHTHMSFVFADFWSISGSNQRAVQTAVDYDVLVGFPDHTFRPHINATRIDSLVVVMRLARALGILDEVW